VYIHYLLSGMTDAAQTLYDAGVEGAATMTQKDLLAQTVEDQPASQWVIASAEKNLRENIVVEQQFAAEGLTLPEGTDAQVQSSVAQEWAAYGEMNEQNGIAQTSLEQVMMNAFKRGTLFTHYYGVDGKTPVADEDLKAILMSDYAKVSLLPIQKAAADVTDENGAVIQTADERNAELKADAESYLQRLNDGEMLEDLYFEYEKSIAGDAAADVVKPEPGSLALIVTADLADSYYSAELVNGALTMAEGTSALTEDDAFYYVMLRTDILENPEDFDSLRSTLLSDLKGDEFNAMVTAWGEELQLDVNQAALNEYTPERLEME
jgi:hypothetical protein